MVYNSIVELIQDNMKRDVTFVSVLGNDGKWQKYEFLDHYSEIQRLILRNMYNTYKYHPNLYAVKETIGVKSYLTLHYTEKLYQLAELTLYVRLAKNNSIMLAGQCAYFQHEGKHYVKTDQYPHPIELFYQDEATTDKDMVLAGYRKVKNDTIGGKSMEFFWV